MLFNTIIIEDSDIAREGLANMLQEYKEINVCCTASTVNEAKDKINQYKPDLLFLDIQLLDQNAFDLLATLNYQPKIIFTTAYTEYALQSFDYNTIDYLLKPLSRSRLSQAIHKLSTPPTEEENQREEPLSSSSRLLIRDQDENHLILLEDIFLLESIKNHTRIYFTQHKPFIHRSLSKIEHRLPSQFFRINRTQIVNLNHIQKISPDESGGMKIKLAPTTFANISRRQASELKSLLSL